MKSKKTHAVTVFFDEETYNELEHIAEDLGQLKVAEILRLASMLGLMEVRETGSTHSYLRLQQTERAEIVA